MVELIGNESVYFHTQVSGKLSHVLFCHHYFLVTFHHLRRILGQGVDELEVSESYLLTGCTKFVHRSVQVAVSTAETDNQQVGIVLIAFYFYVGYFDFGNLLGTQARHQVVVFRVGGDGACLIVLFQSAEDMSETLCSGDGPIAAAGLFVTLVGCP